jgi:nucleoside-diphosphate-sugar epimerase
MDVLVIGGTRFNGLHLVYELTKNGHNVTVLNRGITEASLPKAIRRVYADRKDIEQLKGALQNLNFDVVFDISAYVLEDVEYITEVLKGHTGHYIFASSTVVYDKTDILPITEDFPVNSTSQQSDYGRNKLVCEAFLTRLYREQNFPITIARFSMVFGPDNNLINREQRMFMRMLSNRKILIPGRGTTLSQIGHVDDEARALRMMARDSQTFGEIYNVTGKDYFSDEGYVDTCAKVLGVSPEKIFIPDSIMDKMAINIRQTLIQRLAPYIHLWDHNTLFSIDKLRKHLKYEPDYNLESAMTQTFEWFQSNNMHNTREYDFSDEDKLIAILS